MKRSILWRLIGVIMGVFLVMAALDAWLAPEFAAHTEEDSLKERATTNAAMMVKVVTPALVSGDLSALRKSMSLVLEDSAVVWAALYDDEGRKLESVSRPRVRVPEMFSSAGSVIVSRDLIGQALPVVDERQSIGNVVVAMDRSSIASRRSEMRQAILTRAAIVALLGFLIALLFSSRVVTVVREITAVAERISRGDVSRDVQLPESADELGQMARAFRLMSERLRNLQLSATRVASGDLTKDVEGDGELFMAVRTMIHSLRELASRIGGGSDSIAASAAGMFSAVREQESAAAEQTATLEEIRRTLETLTQSSATVASDANLVRELAQKSLDSSQRIAEQTRLVSNYSNRIGDILTLIQEIADKSDLLALNAALEGTKAGEVGRGFSLIAAEMRRLAEHVMDSVRDIRKLVADMRAASHASVLATEDGNKMARETAASATKISSAASAQQEGTIQVKASADEVVNVVNETLSGNTQITASAEALLQLSHELKEATRAFQLHRGD